MNRVLRLSDKHLSYVPHTRGDEPDFLTVASRVGIGVILKKAYG